MLVRICFGGTRIVLLVGDKAVKFPHMFLPIIHLCKFFHPANCEWRANRISKYARGGSFLAALWRYLTRHLFWFREGLRANQQEHLLFREHPELPIARVHGIYLGGLILVMERGTMVDPVKTAQLRMRFAAQGCDLHESRHVCMFADGLRIIDYGHSNAPRVFGILS